MQLYVNACHSKVADEVASEVAEGAHQAVAHIAELVCLLFLSAEMSCLIDEEAYLPV